MKSLDLASVSTESNFHKRISDIAKIFNFTAETFTNVDAFFDKAESFKNINCIFVDCSKIEKPNEVAGMVQVASQVAANGYIVVIMNSKLQAEDARVIKTSGASLTIMENEYFSSSKVEFVTSQVIRSAFIPVKTTDLIPGTSPDFSLFHLMPANRKFLKVANANLKIRQDFLEKYSAIGELYIQRSELDRWIEYANNTSAVDSQSALRKCRLRFLQLNQSFLQLVLMISDQSSSASFSLGKELFKNCESFANQLLDSLMDLDDPWNVVNSSAVGDFGSLERAPAIAAYAGLLSSLAKLGKPLEIMIGALLADVGYLDLSPSTSGKIRDNRMEDMHGEERMEYQKHPIYSLSQCLSRKLPFTENIKSMILQSHERVDQKGFPNRINPEKMIDEAMLIRLCWELDNACQIRMGQERRPFDEVRREVFSDSLQSAGNYSLGFLMRLKPHIEKSGQFHHGKVRVEQGF